MHLLDPGPKVICELGGEGSISHPCGVGLDNSIDVTNHPTKGKVMCLKVSSAYSHFGGMPRPVQTPPMLQLDEVT